MCASRYRTRSTLVITRIAAPTGSSAVIESPVESRLWPYSGQVNCNQRPVRTGPFQQPSSAPLFRRTMRHKLFTDPFPAQIRSAGAEPSLVWAQVILGRASKVL